MQLHQKFADQGLEIITLFVEGEDTLAEGKALLERLKLSETTNLAVAEGMSEPALAALQMDEDGLLPTLHIYDKKGRLRYQLDGLIDKAAVERHIEELLGEE